MVDRIELCSQIFWLVVVFWFFFIGLVYRILPYIGFALKIRKKKIVKIGELIFAFSTLLVWSGQGNKTLFVDLINSIKKVSLFIINSFILKESEFFAQIWNSFEEEKEIIEGWLNLENWGLCTNRGFMNNLIERAEVYPWLI